MVREGDPFKITDATLWTKSPDRFVLRSTHLLITNLGDSSTAYWTAIAIVSALQESLQNLLTGDSIRVVESALLEIVSRKHAQLINHVDQDCCPIHLERLVCDGVLLD